MSPVAPSMADRDGKIWMDGQMVDWTLQRPADAEGQGEALTPSA